MNTALLVFAGIDETTCTSTVKRRFVNTRWPATPPVEQSSHKSDSVILSELSEQDTNEYYNRKLSEAIAAPRSRSDWYKNAQGIAREWVEYSRKEGVSVETKKKALDAYLILANKYLEDDPKDFLYRGFSPEDVVFIRYIQANKICEEMQAGLDPRSPEWRTYDAAMIGFKLNHDFGSLALDENSAIIGFTIKRLMKVNIPSGEEYKNVVNQKQTLLQALKHAQKMSMKRETELKAVLADQTNLAPMDSAAVGKQQPESDGSKQQVVGATRGAKPAGTPHETTTIIGRWMNSLRLPKFA